MTAGLPYVPSQYHRLTRPYAHGEFYLFHLPKEDGENVTLVAGQIQEALNKTCALLDFRPARTLNFCLFDSLEVMSSAFQRSVSSGLLMAPFASSTDSLIVLQSGSIDARNLDTKRMLRHLSHEIVHSFVAEISGSLKVLGDSNRDMKVEPWIDEGLAECVAAHVANRKDLLLEAQEALALAPEILLSRVNAQLCDLDSPQRGQAFKLATALVLEKSGGKLAKFFAEQRSFSPSTT